MKLTSGHQAGADEKRCLFPWIFSRKAREMSIHQDGIEAVCVLGLYIVHTDDTVWTRRQMWWTGSMDDERDKKMNFDLLFPSYVIMARSFLFLNPICSSGKWVWNLSSRVTIEDEISNIHSAATWHRLALNQC